MSGELRTRQPFEYRFKADLDTRLKLDGKGGLRRGIFEFGLFVDGDAVRVETDPTYKMIFDWRKDKIKTIM